MSTDKSREAFEAWLTARWGRHAEDLATLRQGGYRSGQVQFVWEAWKASRKQALGDAINAVDRSGGDNAEYHMSAIKDLK